MPLSDGPLVLEGGCNCQAIRYRITIPPKAERPMYIAGGGDVSPKVHAPLICTDHCNDCRSATATIINHYILCPIDMVTVSFIDRASPAPDFGRFRKDHPRGSWESASKVFQAPAANPDNYLQFFMSSAARRRGFCARCGTLFTYNIHPTPPGWPGVEFLDLALGSVDREHLEKEDLTPERQLWWDRGIPWVQKQSMQGLDVPRHPAAWVTQIVGVPQSPMQVQPTFGVQRDK